MIEDNLLHKVQILIEQKKFDEAEKLLNDLLSVEPNNVTYLAIFAELCLQKDEIDKAETLISNAIGLAPDFPHLFYIRAQVWMQKEKYGEAENDLNHAISIDPIDADPYAMLAQVKLIRKQYEDALQLSNKALELDAENLIALNSRSTALLKLNRKEDSFKTIEGALKEDPNNAFTHTNYGWGLLEKGDHKKALEHFKEALKNDPNYEYAQAGMVEALKANNIIYRLFLKYAFFMSNLTSKNQWAVIIGVYIGFRVIKSIARSNEALQPFLYPVIFILTIIAFSTWVINPLGNLFLRLNKYGQFLLDKKEKMSSNFVGISFLVFLVGIAGYFGLNDERFFVVAGVGFAMMLPLGVMFYPTSVKYVLVIYASTMALVGVVAIIECFNTGEVFNRFSIIFGAGFILFQWVANYLMIAKNNR